MGIWARYACQIHLLQNKSHHLSFADNTAVIIIRVKKTAISNAPTSFMQFNFGSVGLWSLRNHFLSSLQKSEMTFWKYSSYFPSEPNSSLYLPERNSSFPPSECHQENLAILNKHTKYRHKQWFLKRLFLSIIFWEVHLTFRVFE